MIDKISLEARDFSVALPNIAGKVAFLSDVFQHFNSGDTFDEVIGFNSETIAHMLHEIELDLKTINESLNEKWDEDHKREKGLFDDDKLVEYLMQIKVNDGDPVKILEGWVREHTPYHFEDD